MSEKEYSRLIEIVKTLRDPENGCPWDLKQNIKTLAPSLLEECCECIDGVNSNDIENVKEELGDITFITTLMSYIIEQENKGTTSEVLKIVNDKMIRRHPHVFTNTESSITSDEVIKQWDAIKRDQEGRNQKGLLSKIPRSLTPLEKSNQIQKKVEKVGFDWEDIEDIFSKIDEEVLEVRQEILSQDRDKLELEIGDLLFSVVNLARFLKIDPSVALSRTNSKFTNRFEYIEKRMEEENLELSKENFKVMDSFWNESKKS